MRRIDDSNRKLIRDRENCDTSRGMAVGERAVYRHYVEEISEPTQRMSELGSTFASQVVQLDPDIFALIHVVESTADRSTLENLIGYCRGLILTISGTLQNNVSIIKEYVSGMSRFSQISEIMDEPVMKVTAGAQGMMDGLALIEEWDRRIRKAGWQRPNIPGIDDA